MGFDVQQFIKDQKEKQGNSPEAPAIPAAPSVAAPAAVAAPEIPTAPAPPAAAGATPPSVPTIPTSATPSAPPVGFNPADITTWDRNQLKAEAVRLGVVEGNTRMRKEGLLQKLQELVAAGVQLAAPGTAAPPVAPPPAPEPPAAPPVAPTPMQIERARAMLGQHERVVIDSTNTPAHVAPVPPPVAPTTVPTTSAVATLPEPVPKLLTTLYINCCPIPVPDDTYLLSDILAPILRDMSPEGDYRLHPELGFGKAGGALTEAVLEKLANYKGASIVASTSYTEHRDVLSSLEARAMQVVRGL